MSRRAGKGGHDDQQLAQRGWSQQAVLLWHSWGENVPSTWLVPWGELADGTDAGVCILTLTTTKPHSLGENAKKDGTCKGGQEVLPNRGEGRAKGLQWTGLERGLKGHKKPQADRCFCSLELRKQVCALCATTELFMPAMSASFRNLSLTLFQYFLSPCYYV